MTPNWPSAASKPDPSFTALACAWMSDPANNLLGFVWAAYDNMKASPPVVDTADLERSITQLLQPRIERAMSGDEPFYIQHESYEHETKAPPPAQPPAYDLAFVSWVDERVKWPLEAKVLATPKRLSDYEKDIRNEFLTCRYAPFSSSGAMLGYLLTGSALDVLSEISERLKCDLDEVDGFSSRPHRSSTHKRTVPSGKNYPQNFQCHHLILDYSGLARHKN
jgi:hypothetical protein